MGALMVMEVSKKQHYIFKSRKLKDHIGASLIIRYITEELFEKEGSLNISALGGLLVFKGGGKSLFSFNSTEQAETFIEAYSKHVLQVYPGIELFMSCVDYDEKQDFIIHKIDALFEKLSLKKSYRRFAFSQVDYGVNRVCKESKMPANYLKYMGREIVSAEIAKKIEFAQKMESDHESLNFFNRLLPEHCQYKSQLQDRIDSMKKMIAVVHIDGNNMGQRVLEIKKRFENSDSQSNKTYLNELNQFSTSVEGAYISAFKEMLELLKLNLKESAQKGTDEKFELPIRPLILAGDDICFITEGDYGIECSRIFLEKLYQKKDSTGGNLTACAGIAIIKAKYPFFRGYELAEQLCKNAKKSLAIHKIDASALDWHVSFGEISKSIWEIRELEYVTDEDKTIKLNQRPYVLSNTETVESIMTKYESFIESKRTVDYVTRTSRNTIKSLRNALKTGTNATKDYFEIYHVIKDKMMADEFIDGASRSFDAIEVMDFFKLLEG
ncbi:hypothetical protein [Fusibacter sp. 3D3]|uniref:Cas10/Cmr2 second palm domain-containing protein n=1 Tax=Fusibacter sp. 3D3 TaxID=1048380 RepID=UPI000852EEE3|nr:hypothetical protein [Fusibacter sp. 3D3]GAU79972.1 hypothetical protein F3D3_4637 [Fusibacter sp. 3D3]